MVPERYTINNLKKAVQRPRHFLWEAERLWNTGKNLAKEPLIDALYGGENFMDEDWDNLVILDSCRPEFLRRVNPFGGEFDTKVSLGSHSAEYFKHTFRGNQYHDTVYVTGNPYAEQYAGEAVHKLVKTYADGEGHRQGFLPEPTLDAALEAYQAYPNKRLVVHFMQPHIPYLGERADEIRQQVAAEHDVQFKYTYIQREGDMDVDYNRDMIHLLDAFEQGSISRAELEEAYTENLELVLEYVRDLLDTVDGKTVITADHSESFGDFDGIYEHDAWALSRELRTVPWLVLDDTRRRTFAEPPAEPTAADEEQIRESLRNLGYR